MWINPLTAKRNASPGPGCMSLTAQHSGMSVRSGNYCCSSIRVASIDKNKNSHWKITMTHTQTSIYTLPKLLTWMPIDQIRENGLPPLKKEKM